MSLELPLEEYFKYHPPTTPERIAMHDRVNRESLEICRDLIAIDPVETDGKDIDSICDRAMNLNVEVCQDETVAGWATNALIDAKEVASRSGLVTGLREESVLMYIQQFRMFLNQGITVDELKRNQSK